MKDLASLLRTLVPTVASALLGPLGGAAISAVGSILGIPEATQESIAAAIQTGQLTPEQVGKLKELEIQYQNDEKERGFRYAELEFKDRDSARQANVQGGTQKMLFSLSLVLLILTLGSEIWVLFNGIPPNTPELVIGRVLGLLDSVALMVLAYWYGSSSGSFSKTQIMASK